MELTDKKYWQDYWHKRSDIVEIDTSVYPYRRFDKIFNDFLVKSNRDLIEIGCAYSPWLIYFSKKFGYNVWGLDYSQADCKLTSKILSQHNINSTILCKDIQNNLSELKNKFDVVISFGVIEHFSNPNLILDKFQQLCKDNGLIITVIPNMFAITGALQKFADKTLYSMHKRINRELLLELHDGFIPLKCGYFGSFNTGVINSDRLSGLKGKLFRAICAITSKLLWSFFAVFNYHPESKLFSPYVIFIGKKGVVSKKEEGNSVVS